MRRRSRTTYVERPRKPHIYRLEGIWYCVDRYNGGTGPTPAAAYEGLRMAYGKP